MKLADRAVIELRDDGGALERVKERARQVTRDAWFQAAVSLALAALIEGILGVGGTGRLLFLVPAWLIAERHGRTVGLMTVLGGLALHSLSGRGAESAPLMGAFLQLAIGLAIVFRIDGHLRHTAKFVHMASHDPLTGAANRKTLEGYAERELSRCVTDGRSFAIAVLDCDKFKALNDVYGHAYGDEVLRLLVQSVEKSIGKRGKLGRTGGDEFIVVLPGMTFEDAEARLLQAAEDFGDATLVRGGKASFSVGLAVCPNDGVFLDRLMEAADDDMYRRKALKKAGALFEISA
ncbi:MAG: GGDEF domain-containing protein [Fimbriimonas sp.]